MSLCRKISNKLQSALAEVNSTAEEVLSSMTTVKAHAAEASSHAFYCAKLKKYYKLQVFILIFPSERGLSIAIFSSTCVLDHLQISNPSFTHARSLVIDRHTFEDGPSLS